MNALPVRRFWFPALLIVFGTAMLLARLHVLRPGWAPLILSVVAVGGGIRLYNGLVLKSKGGVFWGFFWLIAGGAGLLRSFDVLWLDPGTVVSGTLLVCGAGFILMFLVSRRDWYLLVPAAFFLLVGGAILSTELGYAQTWEVAPLVNRWWPAGLVLFGAAMLLNHPRGLRAGRSEPTPGA